jgi:hypothetical protein
LKSVLPFRSLQITPPFGGVLVKAVLFLCIFCLTGEGVIRFGVSNGFWSEPLLGTVNAELDIKIQMLDKVAKEKHLDCIFLGSSQFDAAIIPAVFSEQVYLLTGKKLNCFNFSLGTLTSGPAGKVAKMIINRYHPDLLVYGISARDFSRDFGELTRPLNSDPWMKYQLNEANIPGWITQNSLFFRLLNQIRVSFNPDYVVYSKSLFSLLEADGYLALSENKLIRDTDNFIPKYTLYSEDLSGLDEIINLRNYGIQVLIIEVPVHPSFLPVYVEANSNQYYKGFRQPITDRITQHGITFMYSQEEISKLIPDSGWNDYKHLNKDGAKVFSMWVAERIAQSKLLDSSVGNGNH